MENNFGRIIKTFFIRFAISFFSSQNIAREEKKSVKSMKKTLFCDKNICVSFSARFTSRLQVEIFHLDAQV